MNVQRAFRAACLVAAGLALTACGGGGGSAAGGGAPPAPPPVGNTPPPVSGPVPPVPVPVLPGPGANPALRFAPETVTATASAGTSVTAAVSAFALRPADFDGPVFALVVDNAGVILPDARVLAVTATEYSAVIQTAPSLAPGAYTGSFTVKLCRDAGCAAQYPGSPVQLPYAFMVTPAKANVLGATPTTPLRASVHLGAAPPGPVSIKVAGRGLQWQAASSVPWARLAGAAGSGDGGFTVALDTAGLAEGTYEGTIMVASEDGQSVPLPVSLTMLPTPVQAPVGGFLFFNHINGAPLDTQTVKFALESAVPAPWTFTSDSAWAIVKTPSGTTPSTATVAIDPALGTLASGEHRANLTIRSPYGKDFNMLVRLDLAKPVLSTSVPTLTLGGQHGRDFPSLPVTLSLNTGSNAWPWTLSGLPAWATASATSGAVNAAGTTVSVIPDATRAVVGSTTVMLHAQAKVNGDTLIRGIPLTINRDRRKILPSAVGLAMVSTPGWSRLSRTVTVSDNFKLGAAWSAASDKAWLTVQRDGSTLTLTADPATLPSNTTSYAAVTLTPADPGIEAPEKIRIGLWKGSANPAAMIKLDEAYTKVAADPIRPLVYVHGGGATIDIVNVYTAQKTGSITLARPLAEMAVSPDGARLYAYMSGVRGLAVVDLATLTSGTPLALETGGDFASLLPIRPNGVDLIVTDGGNYRVSDGVRLANLPVDGYAFQARAASQDGKRLYVGAHTLASLAADYAETGNGSLFVARVDDQYRNDAARASFDIATSTDGSRVYATSGQRCAVYDANLNPAGALADGVSRPTNVEVDSFDRVYCGGADTQSETDVWVYGAGGALLKRYLFVENRALGLRERQLVVSGDGMMLVALAPSPGMTIIAVGP